MSGEECATSAQLSSLSAGIQNQFNILTIITSITLGLIGFMLIVGLLMCMFTGSYWWPSYPGYMFGGKGKNQRTKPPNKTSGPIRHSDNKPQSEEWTAPSRSIKTPISANQ